MQLVFKNFWKSGLFSVLSLVVSSWDNVGSTFIISENRSSISVWEAGSNVLKNLPFRLSLRKISLMRSFAGWTESRMAFFTSGFSFARSRMHLSEFARFKSFSMSSEHFCLIKPMHCKPWFRIDMTRSGGFFQLLWGGDRTAMSMSLLSCRKTQINVFWTER